MARTLRAGALAVATFALTGPLLAAPAQAATTVGPAPTVGAEVTTVVAVSVDGLRSSAIRKLGPDRAPVLHRLMAEGASTLNARTAREQTNTLPNHTGMLTGRRINASRGGHGVTWNDDRIEPPTVHEAAAQQVDSVFTVVGNAAGVPALFTSKAKFSLFDRSWGESVDRFTLRQHNGRLVGRVRDDLAAHTRSFRFVHLSRPDVAGHDYGFRSTEYLNAVARTDALLGRIVTALEEQGLTDRAVLVVTSDHGGAGPSHRDPTVLANYRVPFVAWGAGVAPGADLYALNPDYANPGRARTSYATTPPPVRNGAVANLVTDLLGLEPVAGSQLNSAQDLDLS